METKKINFKQKKYVIPLVVLPFILFSGFQVKGFFEPDEKEIIATELSTYLGDTKESILSKNEAYDKFFRRKDSRSLLDGLEMETDSVKYYTDNLNYAEKRFVDSLEEARREKSFSPGFSETYYKKRIDNDKYSDYLDDELLSILDKDSKTDGGKLSTKSVSKKEERHDPLKAMKAQLSMMDSITKAHDPDYQAQKLAQEKKEKREKKKQEFLNSTLPVTKTRNSNVFNSVHKDEKDNLIKAIIDENIKGYMGSRIRFRLLEDIYVGKHKIHKGTFLYGEITGFSMQRVALNVVSILNNGEILPINLTVYDTDGLKGLYVPNSKFREMMKEFGTNTAQGANIDSDNQMFFVSMASQLFNSASKTMADMIRKNKVKLKYNSYIYLISEQDLQNNNS